MLSCCRFSAILWLFLSISLPVAGQTLPPGVGVPKTEEKKEPEKPKIDPELARRLATPRRTMETLIHNINEGNLDIAAQTLRMNGTAVAEVRETKAQRLALRLKKIIDRMWYVDFDTLPNNPEATEPFNFGKHLKTVQGRLQAGGKTLSGEDLLDAQQIIITRGDDGLWRFSAQTVEAIPDMFRRWMDRPAVAGVEGDTAVVDFESWVASQFPREFREKHFLIPTYQWIYLLAVIFLGFLADLLTRLALRSLTHAWFKFIRKTESDFRTELQSWRPVGLLVQAMVWYFGVSLISLPDFAMTIAVIALKLFAIVAAVWTTFKAIDLLVAFLQRRAAKTATKFDELLVPLVSRSLKAFVVCVGVLSFAEAFGIPIAGLLGGLGIGGLALAIASKDAVSNFFGSVTVLVDRPFEVGDWIIAGDIEGTVETVGFRSTRIRTFYNSQITVPNSLFTTASVDNMGRRRYRRVKTMISLQYDTRPDQVDAFCEGVRELIRRHPYTRKDYYHVYFNEFADSSINILLYCFVECPDWSIELREKHRLFLDIMRIAEKLGCQFAFPTRTLHMFNEQPGGKAPPIDDPSQTGQRLAEDIAGPLLPPSRRPGTVEFPIPTPVDFDEHEQIGETSGRGSDTSGRGSDTSGRGSDTSGRGSDTSGRGGSGNGDAGPGTR